MVDDKQRITVGEIERHAVHSRTGAAPTFTATGYSGVLLVEWVTALAPRFPSVLCGHADTTPNVLLVGHGLKVAGIDAPRGAAAGELAQVLQNTGVRGDIQSFPDVGEALRYAYNAAGENDRIAAFGSFYTVAEAMQEKGLVL